MPIKRLQRKARFKRLDPMKFLLILLLIICYLGFSMYKHGIEEGIAITVLMWSFFVFLTPIPSAGLIFELPIRLLTKHKMMTTQYYIWAAGAVFVIPAFLFFPGIFDSTGPLKIFHYVLTNPIPYSILLLICAAGTAISVHLADEIVDEAEDEIIHHKRKHISWISVILFLVALAAILLTYENMVSTMDLGNFNWI